MSLGIRVENSRDIAVSIGERYVTALKHCRLLGKIDRGASDSAYTLTAFIGVVVHECTVVILNRGNSAVYCVSYCVTALYVILTVKRAVTAVGKIAVKVNYVVYLVTVDLKVND